MNINIIEENNKWNLLFNKNSLFIWYKKLDINDNNDNWNTEDEVDYLKEILKLIKKIVRISKRKKLYSYIKNNINSHINELNLTFFDKRWIINKSVNIFNQWIITNIMFPILIDKEDIKKLKKILNKISSWKVLKEQENEFIDSINFILNNTYCLGINEILTNLYKFLELEFSILEQIITNKYKVDKSLFFVNDRWRNLFIYIKGDRVIPLNIYINKKTKLVEVWRDHIYIQDLRKTNKLFNNSIRIKSINKNMITKILCDYYDFKENDIWRIVNIKDIKRTEITKIINKF